MVTFYPFIKLDKIIDMGLHDNMMKKLHENSNIRL